MRFKLLKKYLALVVMGSQLVACASNIKTPYGRKFASLENLNAGERKQKGLEAYARVLNQFVDNDGWVNFAGLQKEPQDLELFLQVIAEVGPNRSPQAFKDANERLAFLINTYNALAMYNVLEFGIPERNSGLMRLRFFILKKFKIDGQWMSLKTYEDDHIRSLGESKVHWVLNCMAASCPKLKNEPFVGRLLEKDLQDAARFFFSEPRNLRVDHPQKTLFMTEIFDFFPEDFMKTHPSFDAYINQFVDEPLPEDYEIEFIDYDWTIIDQGQRSMKPI